MTVPSLIDAKRLDTSQYQLTGLLTIEPYKPSTPTQRIMGLSK